MASLPIGFLAMIALIYYSVGGGKSWGMYVNEHALLLVVFGTFAILAFTTPVSALRSLARAMRELFSREHGLTSLRSDFEALSHAKRLAQPSRHPLINSAAELWEQGVSSELFIVLISQKRAEIEEVELDAIQALRNLAKYPPALGMTGTVIGLIALFKDLGADSQASLGPALALAMTATFFGLIMANVVVQPLADRLHVRHLQTKRLCKNVYQLLLLINQGEAKGIVDDEVETRAAA